MKIVILNEHEVEQLLTMRECITVMEEALADLAPWKGHQSAAQHGPPGLKKIARMLTQEEGLCKAFLCVSPYYHLPDAVMLMDVNGT